MLEETRGEIWNGYITFKSRASYIYDGRTANLQMLHFMYFFQKL